MIGFARFDPELFRRQLMKYTDLGLIKMGRACATAEWLIADPVTKSEQAKKYELCREEWRRHPKRAGVQKCDTVRMVGSRRVASGKILYEIVRNRANPYKSIQFRRRVSLVNPMDRSLLGVRFPPAPPICIPPVSLFTSSSLPTCA